MSGTDSGDLAAKLMISRKRLLDEELKNEILVKENQVLANQVKNITEKMIEANKKIKEVERQQSFQEYLRQIRREAESSWKKYSIPSSLLQPLREIINQRGCEAVEPILNTLCNLIDPVETISQVQRWITFKTRSTETDDQATGENNYQYGNRHHKNKKSCSLRQYKGYNSSSVPITWESVRQLVGWNNLRGGCWKDSATVSDLIRDCRYYCELKGLSDSHHLKEISLFAPIFIYTAQVFERTVWALWHNKSSRWIQVPIKLFKDCDANRENGCLNLSLDLMSFIAYEINVIVDKVPIELKLINNYVFGLTIYGEDDAALSTDNKIHLIRYRNEGRGENSVSPLCATVGWIPSPSSLVNDSGIQCYSDNLKRTIPPPGVIEFITSRDALEENERIGVWKSFPLELPHELRSLKTLCESQRNKLKSSSELTKLLLEYLDKNNNNALSTTIQSRMSCNIRQTSETKNYYRPTEILDALTIQILVWHGRSFCIQGSSLDYRVILTDWVTCVPLYLYRVFSSSEEQPYSIISSVIEQLSNPNADMSTFLLIKKTDKDQSDDSDWKGKYTPDQLPGLTSEGIELELVKRNRINTENTIKSTCTWNATVGAWSLTCKGRMTTSQVDDSISNIGSWMHGFVKPHILGLQHSLSSIYHSKELISLYQINRNSLVDTNNRPTVLHWKAYTLAIQHPVVGVDNYVRVDATSGIKIMQFSRYPRLHEWILNPEVLLRRDVERNNEGELSEIFSETNYSKAVALELRNLLATRTLSCYIVNSYLKIIQHLDQGNVDIAMHDVFHPESSSLHELLYLSETRIYLKQLLIEVPDSIFIAAVSDATLSGSLLVIENLFDCGRDASKLMSKIDIFNLAAVAAEGLFIKLIIFFLTQRGIIGPVRQEVLINPLVEASRDKQFLESVKIFSKNSIMNRFSNNVDDKDSQLVRKVLSSFPSYPLHALCSMSDLDDVVCLCTNPIFQSFCASQLVVFNKEGWLPQHSACSNSCYDKPQSEDPRVVTILEILFQNQCDRRTEKFSNSETCLMLSARNGFVHLCTYLLNCGADPFLKNKNDKMAVEEALFSLRMEAFNYLISRLNLDVQLFADSVPPNALQIAIGGSDLTTVRLLLGNFNLNLDSADSRIGSPAGRCCSTSQPNTFKGCTALHEACSNPAFNSPQSITLLKELKTKRNINMITPGGCTALHRAAFYGHHRICSVLLGMGADPYQLSENGDVPLTSLEISIEQGWVQTTVVLNSETNIKLGVVLQSRLRTLLNWNGKVQVLSNSTAVRLACERYPSSSSFATHITWSVDRIPFCGMSGTIIRHTGDAVLIEFTDQQLWFPSDAVKVPTVTIPSYESLSHQTRKASKLPAWKCLSRASVVAQLRGGNSIPSKARKSLALVSKKSFRVGSPIDS